MKFSANLGFLWANRPLPEAIRAAKHAGFDAVVEQGGRPARVTNLAGGESGGATDPCFLVDPHADAAGFDEPRRLPKRHSEQPCAWPVQG